MRYIYIGQFGACFRLRFDRFIALLENGAAGRGYDLEDYAAKELKRFPHGVLLDMPGESDRRSSMRSDLRYFEPLDWDAQDFQDVLAEMREPSVEG